MRIAFLGLGWMGAGMAAHIPGAGHELTVWNRTAGKAGPLRELGASEAGDVADAVTGAHAVVLMLFGAQANREVLAQVVGGASKGALIIDSMTIGPDAAREFGEQCAAAGLRYLDAPVAGSRYRRPGPGWHPGNPGRRSRCGLRRRPAAPHAVG